MLPLWVMSFEVTAIPAGRSNRYASNPEGNRGDEINFSNSSHRLAGWSGVPPFDSI